MEKAIKKAIEGGYKSCGEHRIGTSDFKELVHDTDILLDPLFWQALGKAEGWGRLHCTNCGEFAKPVRKNEDDPEYWHDCCRRKHLDYGVSDKIHYLEFMEHIWNGGDINSFFEELLK